METKDIVMIIVSAILFIASLITALTVIYKAFEKSVGKIVKKEIDKDREEDNKRREEDQEKLRLLKEESTLNYRMISEVKDIVNNNSTVLSESMVELRENDKIFKKSLLEIYRKDIRKIYNKYLQTGELADYDKAYADVIFPLYKDMGGNHDITHKYEDMNELYAEDLKHKVRSKRKKKQEQATKKVE